MRRQHTGVLERRLIYAASRSLKPAETKCSKIRRELLVVVFPIRKFKRFLKETEFIIWTDHMPLEGLFKKSILSIENEDLRDVVAKISDFHFWTSVRSSWIQRVSWLSFQKMRAQAVLLPWVQTEWEEVCLRKVSPRIMETLCSYEGKETILESDSYCWALWLFQDVGHC